MYLTKDKLLEEINDQHLIIRPLIDKDSQVNEISIDFRLGCDFLVSIQGRDSFIDASLNSYSEGNSIEHFFQETRRKIGETFLLHPGQTVLGSSLEYVKLPNNIFAVLNMRSSYSRLGLSISSTLHPGYCGCISLELINTSKNAIKLTAGACLFQARFALVEKEQPYFSRKRKYMCQVRPQLTQFSEDNDLKILNDIWKRDNKI